MIHYEPGREVGGEWEPGRWEINAGVACAATAALTIAACITVGFIFRTEAVAVLCAAGGFAALLFGGIGTVGLIDEWIPLTGHRAGYRAKKRAEQEAYIRWLERQARL